MPRKAAPAQLAVAGRSLSFLTLDPFELIEREIANLYSSAARQIPGDTLGHAQFD